MDVHKLKQKLSFYYEVDIDNCTMTHDDWITELANAMLHPDFYKEFIREYDENRRDRWADCDVCEGENFIVSNDEDGNEQIQKCDECNIFETDEEAQQHYKDFH